MKFARELTLRDFLRPTLVAGLATVAGAALLADRAAAKPDPKVTRDERNIALVVSSMMDQRHLSQLGVGDEVSKRAFEMFFKELDPMKLYFYQSDIQQFAGEQTKIDDEVKGGHIELANRVFDVFLQRVGERTAAAHRFIDQDHDFTVDESMERDPKKLNWFANAAEADERWRKRIKYDILLMTTDDEEASAKKHRTKSPGDATPLDGAANKEAPAAEPAAPIDPVKALADAREKLHKRYKSINRRWEQTSDDELLEFFLTAITSSFDPHSSYMSPRNLQNFIIQMQLSLDGIGASLESKYGETVVRSLVPGGAAEKDGRLKVDDVITGVAQAAGEMEDITDMPLNDVVDKIRGKPNTVVRLEVKTAGGAGMKVYDVTRAHIELKDSEARSKILMRTPDGKELGAEAKDPDHLADPPAGADAATKPPSAHIVEQKDGAGNVIKVGVIELPSFYMDMDGRRAGREDYKSTARDMRRLLDNFNQEKVDVAIVDLRFNGGGSLPESVDTTGLFIDQGPVVQVKGPDGAVQPYPDDKAGAVWNGPLIVVINKFSASASEIFAGAIQDYGRGIIVGDRSTHGKGTVQQLENLGEGISRFNPPNYGALKMTIQQFYRPGGDSTQNRGVVSDVELASITSQLEVGESDLDYALKFDRVVPLPHENYPYARAQVVQDLRSRSQKRCAESDFFKAEQRRIERYNVRKDEPLPLNREKFLAERKEFDSDKEQEKMIDELQTNDRPVFPKSAYNEELVSIALDYLQLLGDSRLAAVR